jgi:spore germination cell wall hydrolase CwlJ-like protein
MRAVRKRKAGAAPRRPNPLGLGALVAVLGSCSTMTLQQAQQDLSYASVSLEIPQAAAALDASAPPLLTGIPALEANAALPVATSTGPTASSWRFAAATPIAQMRAGDCLAQAIFYEARSESEEGQRAVAQVVLNRVRHPAWPNSVCGVVYQGAMRPGGGCQFTFTCDGSLRFAPYGEGWTRARRLAGEALAGRVFEPVGLSTFYHANYVMPGWAPRLLKTAVIGTHMFYRLPGNAGSSGAFSDRYAGVEPIARPNPTTVFYGPSGRTLASQIWSVPVAPAEPRRPIVQDVPAPVIAPTPLEDAQIRPEYRQSGQWRTDAPAAITGR